MTGSKEVLTGVSWALWSAWRLAHDAENTFREDTEHGVGDLTTMVDYLLAFFRAASAIGVFEAEAAITYATGYVARHKPANGGLIYSEDETEDHISSLDRQLNIVHRACCRLTRTDATDWYDLKYNGVPALDVLALNRLAEQRGPGAPFLMELWKRTASYL